MPGTALQGLLDLFPEPVVALRGSGLYRSPHSMDQCRIQCLPEKFAVSQPPDRRRCPQGKIKLVRLQHTACLTHCISLITGPGITSRMQHHPGTYRIELDISHTCQQVAITRDPAAPVSALPECAALSIALIHVTDLLAPSVLDCATDRFTRLRCHQQMHMIGHQHITVNAAPVSETCLMQPSQIGGMVVIRKKPPAGNYRAGRYAPAYPASRTSAFSALTILVIDRLDATGHADQCLSDSG
jgi:hypothetical protein